MGGWLAGLCAAMVVLAPAAAQTRAPEDAALEGLRRQEERGRQLQRDLQPDSDVLSPPQPRSHAEPPDAERPCAVVRELRFEGPDTHRFPSLNDAALPYLGKCLGASGLARLAGRLDEQLLRAGYATTRVSLPAQNLQAGVLLIRLHVGRIAEVRMVDLPSGAPAGRGWRNAFPLSAGDILNIRDVEQGVEQMRRVPSQSVTTQLEPGPEADTSILVIERKASEGRERLRGGLTVDNGGGAAMGAAQLSSNVSLDNPLALNDLISVSFNTNLERPSSDHHSQSVGVDYSVPWGYSTFSVSASHSRFAQYVQGTTVRFLSSGHSQTAQARLNRTVWRDSSAKLALRGALSMRRARSFLDDVEVLVQRRDTTSAEIGASYKQLLKDSALDVDISHRRGISWSAQEDLPTANAGGPTIRPKLWAISANYTKSLRLPIGNGLPLQYEGQLRGQFTPDTTLAIDQLAIGGRHSVRGFDGDSVLLAENGWVLRNEVATPASLGPRVRNAVWFAALDAGRVWGPSDTQLIGRSLAGAAFGLRGSVSDTHFQIALATPVHQPEGFRTRRWSVYASLSQAY